MNDMDQFMISGIQQVGVGTENFNKTWNWLNEMFGADVKILEDDTVAERMLPYTGGQAQQRHASIVANLQGGGGFEIAVGDLGIFAAKVACRDIAAFHRELSAKWTDLSTPATLPDGTPCFYVKDPFGKDSAL